MASDQSMLRARAKNILESPQANSIRFKLANIRVQTLQLGTIGRAIFEGKIQVTMNGGHYYNPNIPAVNWDDVDEDAFTIVHEATHAAIHAYHAGQDVMLGVHEAAAYLAEAMYEFNKSGQPPSYADMPNIRSLVPPVAQAALEFNRKHAAATYVVSSDQYDPIIAAMQNSRGTSDQYRIYKQVPIKGVS